MKNIDEILAMAQNVQNELQNAQAKLDTIEVEGVAGGGLVRIKASAKGRVIGIAIDDSLMAASEKQMLEDLLAAAFNDARAKADAASSEEMGKMTAGMPLPPGFKLPFLKSTRPDHTSRRAMCGRVSDQMNATRVVVRRRNAAPTSPKPPIAIAQVAGSGTLGVGTKVSIRNCDPSVPSATKVPVPRSPLLKSA